MAYFYIALTIFLTVYGQLIIKWQVSLAGQLPVDNIEKIMFFLGLIIKPWVISAFIAAFLASIAWMATVSKLDLSHAYPFMSLNFVLVFILSAFLFHEPISMFKIIGILLIVAGLIVGSHG